METHAATAHPSRVTNAPRRVNSVEYRGTVNHVYPQWVGLPSTLMVYGARMRCSVFFHATLNTGQDRLKPDATRRDSPRNYQTTLMAYIRRQNAGHLPPPPLSSLVKLPVSENYRGHAFGSNRNQERQVSYPQH